MALRPSSTWLVFRVPYPRQRVKGWENEKIEINEMKIENTAAVFLLRDARSEL